MYEEPKFLCSGEGCLVVEFSDDIDINVNIRLQSVGAALAAKRVRGILDLVPTYRSLAVVHDPLVLPRRRLLEIVGEALRSGGDGVAREKRVLVIPVAYGGEHGPDIENVARHTGFDVEEVIARHSAPDYYCFMLGFTPGFSYLGGMDEALETPRLEVPRILIPAGSVGIAGRQTGAYSIDSPGGWQLIGRTPAALFDPTDAVSPTLVEAGDWIRFRRISTDEYREIAAAVASRTYKPERISGAPEGGACL